MTNATKVRIILLKEHAFSGTTYPKGQLLDVDEQHIEYLEKEEIAEVYKPKAGDEIQASPVSSGMTKEDIQAILSEAMKVNMDEAIKERIASGDRVAAVEEKFDKKGGYNEFWEFAMEVAKAAGGSHHMPERLEKWDKQISLASKTAGYMEAGDPTQGGFLVPVEFRNQILEYTIEASIIRPRATIIPMQTGTVKIPVVAESSRASSIRGGVIIYRPDEGATITVSNAKFDNVELNLNRLAGLVHVSSTLLEDSPISLQPIITRHFGEAMAFQEDEDFIRGTGAGMSLGVLNAPGIVSITKETGQAGTTIVTENIVKMFSRMIPSSISAAVWLANIDTFPMLYTLTLNVGTGGLPVGLLQNQNIQGAPGMAMLGIPIIFTEHAATLGTTGDIILGDWRQYLIGQKAGQNAVRFDTSIHVRFVTDESSFRFITRVDGQPWARTALTPKNSSNTLGHFVKINAR